MIAAPPILILTPDATTATAATDTLGRDVQLAGGGNASLRAAMAAGHARSQLIAALTFFRSRPVFQSSPNQTGRLRL